LTTRVVFGSIFTGTTSCMAQLSKEWACDGEPEKAYAAFYQTVQLPAAEASQSLRLSFWYRMFSYDVAHNKEGRWYDTFEVYVYDRNGNELGRLLQDGNPRETIPPGTGCEPWLKWDSGPRYFSADLAAWAGQQVRIEFRIWNREDSWYPTWVYVDDVKLLPSHYVYLPLLRGGRSMAAALPVSQFEPQDHEAQVARDSAGGPPGR
jgi:hypothetical protein